MILVEMICHSFVAVNALAFVMVVVTVLEVVVNVLVGMVVSFGCGGDKPTGPREVDPILWTVGQRC